MINECLEPQEEYDEWNERRDGFRTPFDNSKIRDKNCLFNESQEVSRYNKKLKRLLKVRKAKKDMRKLKNE